MTHITDPGRDGAAGSSADGSRGCSGGGQAEAEQAGAVRMAGPGGGRTEAERADAARMAGPDG
uniref:hypothetical protein n=1 Tax=Paenibacillus graminis TaxID=189425 RepID=UPI00046F1A19